MQQRGAFVQVLFKQLPDFLCLHRHNQHLHRGCADGQDLVHDEICAGNEDQAMEQRGERGEGGLDGQEGNVGEPHRHGEVPAEFPVENDGRNIQAPGTGTGLNDQPQTRSHETAAGNRSHQGIGGHLGGGEKARQLYKQRIADGGNQGGQRKLHPQKHQAEKEAAPAHNGGGKREADGGQVVGNDQRQTGAAAGGHAEGPDEGIDGHCQQKVAGQDPERVDGLLHNQGAVHVSFLPFSFLSLTFCFSACRGPGWVKCQAGPFFRPDVSGCSAVSSSRRG